MSLALILEDLSTGLNGNSDGLSRPLSIESVRSGIGQLRMTDGMVSQ